MAWGMKRRLQLEPLADDMHVKIQSGMILAIQEWFGWSGVDIIIVSVLPFWLKSFH